MKYDFSKFPFSFSQVWNSVDVETQMITTTTQKGEIRRCMARGARWAEFNFEQPYVCDILCTVSAHAAERNSRHRSSTRFCLDSAFSSPSWVHLNRWPIPDRSINITDRHFYLSFYPPIWYFFPTFPRDQRRDVIFIIEEETIFFVSKVDTDQFS